MAVEHEQRNVHLLSSYLITVVVSGGVRSSLLKQALAASIAQQGEVDGLELPKYVFLRGTTIIPSILRIRKSVEGREQAVAISDELILLHEPASNTAESLIVISN